MGMNRRLRILSALLTTALVLYCLPGLLARQLGDTGRTDDRLKQAPSRTMVVWVTSWMEEDRKLISSLCSAFEKQRPGLRIFLRRGDAEELYGQDAVLPDAVLHVTGDVLSPDDAFVPMSLPENLPQQVAASGTSQGTMYGLPLWYSPLVFSVPKGWFADGEQDRATDEGGLSYFSLGTPSPEKPAATITFEDVPWRRLTESGQIVSESGMGLAGLLLHCPTGIREEMHRLEPQIRKPQPGEAAVCSLASHMARQQENLCLPLTPSLSQRVRYLSLCKESEDALAFVRFLLGEEAQAGALAAQLIPAAAEQLPEGTLAEQLAAGGDPFLPNGFQLDLTAMDQLCIQGFLKGEDPVATLLKLR